MAVFTFVFDVDLNAGTKAGKNCRTAVAHVEAPDWDAALRECISRYDRPLIRAAFEGRLEPLRGEKIDDVLAMAAKK